MSAGGHARQLKRAESSQSATSCTNFTTAEILQTFVVAGHRRWHSILLMFQERNVGEKTFAELQWRVRKRSVARTNGRALTFFGFFWCATFLRVLGINGDSVHLKARIWKASLHSAFTCIYNASHLLGTTLHFRYLQIVGSWILCFLFVAGPGARGPVQVQWTPWELCCGHGRLGVFQDVQKRRSFFLPCVKFG